MALSAKDLQVNEFRTVLCDAAIKIITEDGIDALTLRCLAAEVGCSRQTPYNYFRNKNELLEEVFVRCHQTFIDYCESAVEDVMNVREKLRNIRDVATKFQQEQQDIYKVMDSEPQTQSMPRVDELRAYELMRLTSFFREAVEQGIVKGDPIVLSVMFTSTIDTLGQFNSFPEDKKFVKVEQLADFVETTFFPPA
jgi:AcrR family transcriptional regulator